MQLAELIALAKIRSGKSQQSMAEEMGHNGKSRISKIGKGELTADASEIVYLANSAHMNPILVLAEIESERHPQLAAVWKKTIENMKAGITSLYYSLGDRRQRPRFSAR